MANDKTEAAEMEKLKIARHIEWIEELIIQSQFCADCEWCAERDDYCKSCKWEIDFVRTLQSRNTVLEEDWKRMRATLKDFESMQAEDNFKSWQDKVNDIQTWQEKFLNQVVMKPINDYAKEILSSLHHSPESV